MWVWTKVGTNTGGAPSRASTGWSWRSQQPVLTITVLLPSGRASSDIAGAWVWPETNTASSKLGMSPAIGGGRWSSRSSRIATSSRLRSDPGANQGNREARVVTTSLAVRRLMRNTTTRANASTATP
jgi:hypothetical protein